MKWCSISIGVHGWSSEKVPMPVIQSVQVHQVELLIIMPKKSSLSELRKGVSYLIRRTRGYPFLSLNDNPLSIIILEHDSHSIRTMSMVFCGIRKLSLLLRQKQSDDFMIWNLILVVHYANNSSLPKRRILQISGSSGLIAQTITIL